MKPSRAETSRPHALSPVSRTGSAGPISAVSNFANHTILLGDCVEHLRNLPRESVDLVFADPPYNLQLAQNLSRPDQSIVEGVDEAWDKFANFAEYDTFTKAWLQEIRRVMKPQATLFVMGSYHNIFRIGSILQDMGFWILNDIIWCKVNPMPNFKGRRFTNAHETLIWASRDPHQKSYTFHYEALKASNEDSQMRSDWFLPICKGSERLKDEKGRSLHPTQKPEALLNRILLSASNPGDVVLDPFAGSGTTGAVAKRLGRAFIGIERDLLYAQAARIRIDATSVLPSEALATQRPKRQERRIPFLSLLEAGLVHPGERAWDQYRRFEVIVRANGTLALGDIAGSIHKLGALVQGLPACNGWPFWHVEREGNLISMDSLRDIFRKKIQQEGEVCVTS